MPHDPGFPEHEGSGPPPPVVEANRENFFFIFFDPQAGHVALLTVLERTSISLSFPHC
jgi:hypothetical protein